MVTVRAGKSGSNRYLPEIIRLRAVVHGDVWRRARRESYAERFEKGRASSGMKYASFRTAAASAKHRNQRPGFDAGAAA